MAREKIGAAVALVASAALAPVTLPPEAEVTDHGDGTATVSVPGPSPDEWLSRVAELNTEVGALRAELAKVTEQRDASDAAHAATLAERDALRTALGEQREASRTALIEQRDAFDAAWAARERELAGPEPVTARRFRAVGSLRCHLRGAPITVADGAMIPDGVDLSTLPSDAFEEAR